MLSRDHEHEGDVKEVKADKIYSVKSLINQWKNMDEEDEETKPSLVA